MITQGTVWFDESQNKFLAYTETSGHVGTVTESACFVENIYYASVLAYLPKNIRKKHPNLLPVKVFIDRKVTLAKNTVNQDG